MEENTQEVVENTVPVEQVVEEPAHADNTANVNMVKLRAAKDAEKERADRLEAQVEELKKHQEAAANPEEPAYDVDGFIEGKDLRNFEQKQAKKYQELEKRQQEFEARQRETSEAAELRRKFTDFSKVMTDENADKLKELDPEMFMTIANSTASHYQRSVAAYKRIKELGIFVEDKHAADREQAQANVNKPRPMNSVAPQQGDSPLSMANAFAGGRLTDEAKRLLWKETQEACNKL